MTKLEFFKGVFSLSACFWMLYTLYAMIRVRYFIINRYEQETNLSKTKYFTEMMPWAKHIPPFFRSSIYLSHLLKFRWYEKKDRFATKKKNGKGEIVYYDDIMSPEQVTSHFSKKEIRLVKRVVYVFLLVVIHVAGLYILKVIWPETFISG